jgi:hypothetical protein
MRPFAQTNNVFPKTVAMLTLTLLHTTQNCMKLRLCHDFPAGSRRYYRFALKHAEDDYPCGVGTTIPAFPAHSSSLSKPLIVIRATSSPLERGLLPRLRA